MRAATILKARPLELGGDLSMAVFTLRHPFLTMDKVSSTASKISGWNSGSDNKKLA